MSVPPKPFLFFRFPSHRPAYCCSAIARDTTTLPAHIQRTRKHTAPHHICLPRHARLHAHLRAVSVRARWHARSMAGRPFCQHAPSRAPLAYRRAMVSGTLHRLHVWRKNRVLLLSPNPNAFLRKNGNSFLLLIVPICHEHSRHQRPAFVSNLSLQPRLAMGGRPGCPRAPIPRSGGAHSRLWFRLGGLPQLHPSLPDTSAGRARD